MKELFYVFVTDQETGREQLVSSEPVNQGDAFKLLTDLEHPLWRIEQLVPANDVERLKGKL